MNQPDKWILLSEIEPLLPVTGRAIRKALRNSTTATINGQVVEFRKSFGRGGKGGSIWQARRDTLPIHIQDALNCVQMPVQQASGFKATQSLHLWNAELARLAPLKGKELALAIASLVAKPPLRENGKAVFASESTIRKKLKNYKTHGMRALLRKVRKTKGTKLVSITREFDDAAEAFGLTESQIEEISHDLDIYVKSLIGEYAARSTVIMLAQDWLNNRAIDLGIDVSASGFKLPQYYVQNRRMWRKLARLRKDAKAHQDAMPSIRRHIHDMEPMQLVVGDVHPIDVLVQREDGSTAHPRLIVWMDVGTQRVFATVVLLAKGEGVRNTHIIDSFKELVANKGMPWSLYLDNGSEYNFADFLVDGLKLISEDGRVIRSLPYNAQSKIAERWHSRFEADYMRHLQGYVGGNRMTSLRENVGKEIVPYTDGIVQFTSYVLSCIDVYNAKPLKQHGNKSPNMLLGEWIANGWQRTEVTEFAFALAFSVEEIRDVNQGCIKFGGEEWQVPADYTDNTIVLLVPKYERWDRLPLKDRDGNFVGFAERVKTYSHLDPEGAVVSATRKKQYTAAVRALGDGLPHVDVVGNLINLSRRLPAPPQAPVGKRLGPSDEAQRLLNGLRETEQDRILREAREREAKDNEIADQRKKMHRLMVEQGLIRGKNS